MNGNIRRTRQNIYELYEKISRLQRKYAVFSGKISKYPISVLFLRDTISSVEDHDAIVRIRFFTAKGNLVFLEPIIQWLHLVAEFLDVIEHDERIRSHLGERGEEIVEIFSLHRIDKYKVKIGICERRNDGFCVSPDGVNIFDFTVFEVLDRFDMRVPGVLDRGNGRFDRYASGWY